jgi:hypothetical protein
MIFGTTLSAAAAGILLGFSLIPCSLMGTALDCFRILGVQLAV